MLYIVATPIGNLKDITLRALEILKEADLILCEDTRVTKNLLDRYNIGAPMESYHEHTSETKVKEIARRLKEKKKIALVTDAGTPGIADPGNKLIAALVKDLELAKLVSPIPGPAASIAALSVCGFPTDKFLFLGFPPSKKRRQQFWRKIAGSDVTVVFYESPHKIIKSLKELAVLIPERSVMIGRELTKKFETIYRGTINEILKRLLSEKPRGEFVIVINSK